MTTTAFDFVPEYQSVGHLTGRVGSKTIHSEEMYFSCDPSWIRDRPTISRPLTTRVLDLLETAGEMAAAQEFCREHGKWLVVDTRSHMLMPGMYPAIPGWHCDAYPRHEYNSQPDLGAANPKTPHYVLHLSDHVDGVSRTIFAERSLSTLVSDKEVWRSVDLAARHRNIGEYQFRDGVLVKFLQPTLHRAEMATHRGWRWWFRMSAYYQPPVNEIRKQVQVYTTEGGGW